MFGPIHNTPHDCRPGGIVSAIGHTFQAPPPQRELPSARLLRHAFLLAEATNVQDYRAQIPSTAWTKALKERAGVMELLTQPQPLLPLPMRRTPQPLLSLPLPVRRTPATSTITRPVPSPSSATPETAGPSTWPTMPASQSSTLPIMPASTSTTSHSTDSPLSWSRSTYYKRKLKDHPSGVGTKLLRVQNLPACKICGQPTQGHKKHRKKEFLPSENDVPFERPGQQSVRQLRTIHLCC